jgi:uncharacterized protein (DUF924 family)
MTTVSELPVYIFNVDKFGWMWEETGFACLMSLLFEHLPRRMVKVTTNLQTLRRVAKYFNNEAVVMEIDIAIVYFRRISAYLPLVLRNPYLT